MTTGIPILRALVIYGICVPLAVMVGYLLANPIDWGSLMFLLAVLVILSIPFLLKWHQAMLLFCWNAAAIAFFVPGRPGFWMVMAGTSLTISVLQRPILQRMKFVHVPSVAKPLLFLLLVTFVTARLTGGVGFRIFGGDTFGGRKYLDVMGAIVAYFALTAHRVPRHRAMLCCSLFLLGGVTHLIGSLIHVVNPAFYFIFWIFPAESQPGGGLFEGQRLPGLAAAAISLIFFLIARYGLRGVFLSGKTWRWLLVLSCTVLALFSGYRTIFLGLLLTISIMFYLEGMFKSRLLPVLALGGFLCLLLTLVFLPKMPPMVQRSLAFLPVEVDPEIRASVEETTNWRLQIWREVLPEVPKNLLLGKGYSLRPTDYLQQQSGLNQSYWNSMIAGDYHSGPLSVVVPFGLWGVLGFGWMLWAGARMLYRSK